MGCSYLVWYEFDNIIVQPQLKILKWDHDNPSNCDTTFSYTLSSAQKKNCQVIIDIYNTEGNKVYETTLTQLCPGAYTFTWDGTANQTSYPPNNIAPVGLYTFDITVNGKTPDGLVINDDKDRMRSSALKIVDHDAVMIDIDKYRVSYILNDTKEAYQAGVDAYDPDLQKLTGITDGTAKAPTINTADIAVQTDVCGTYRFIFWAIDDHRELDKSHRRKPALEVNKAYTIPSAANFAFHTFWGLKGSTRKAAQVAA